MKMTQPSINIENNNHRLNSHQSAWSSNWSCSLMSCAPALSTLLRSLFCSSVRFCNEIPDSVLCLVIEFHQSSGYHTDVWPTMYFLNKDFQWIFGRISSESPSMRNHWIIWWELLPQHKALHWAVEGQRESLVLLWIPLAAWHQITRQCRKLSLLE